MRRTTVIAPVFAPRSDQWYDPASPDAVMTPLPAKGPADADLARRRAQIRRGLRRANTAGVLILLIVIGLSAAALFQALRAERNARTAETASTRAQNELWRAQLARARAEH